ncbi:MAG: carboxynorspermidine decarboxylase [Clostridiales bacterium]|nr:carboxynorspermidine decarboxylase [Clostridiales bacterium]
MRKYSYADVPTPTYIVDRRLLENNLKILNHVQSEAGCKILGALKGFSMYHFFPLMGEYLSGITSSSLHEARLGYEEMGKEVHIYSPAFIESEFNELLEICDHFVFNSFDQLSKYKERVKSAGKECGIRINPEYSEIMTDLYNPCFTYSRLGVTLQNFDESLLFGVDGIHFHTMCEQNSDTLERTIEVIENKFGKYLHRMKWINFGGGHHITRGDYDIDKLIAIIKHIKEKYNVEVYLEPGETIALNTGFLATSVIDIVNNVMDIAILDTSAACHMPDVLEMPYRPEIIGAGKPGEFEYTYRLGGLTCLAGDVIGDYSFKEPLKPGDRFVFTDMAHYTMVKSNTFNGVNLPSIAVADEDGIELLKTFNYEDYKRRL